MKNESFSSLSPLFPVLLWLFSSFSHVHPTDSPSLHPRGELRRPSLYCFSHSFHFPWLCRSLMLLTFPHSCALFVLIFPEASSNISPRGTQWYWQLYFFEGYCDHVMQAEPFPIWWHRHLNAGAEEPCCLWPIRIKSLPSNAAWFQGQRFNTAHGSVAQQISRFNSVIVIRVFSIWIFY